MSVLAQGGAGGPRVAAFGAKGPQEAPPTPPRPPPHAAVAPAHLVNRTLQMLHS